MYISTYLCQDSITVHKYVDRAKRSNCSILKLETTGKLENPTDSHDIVDKADHCNCIMCYPSTDAVNHISDYKTNKFDQRV